MRFKDIAIEHKALATLGMKELISVANETITVTNILTPEHLTHFLDSALRVMELKRAQ